MCHKIRGRKVQCFCFSDDPTISSHLIHDALNDSHQHLEGCIAPGLTSDEKEIKSSAEAMRQVFVELGGIQEWGKKTITVENNIVGEETKEQWIKRRKKLERTRHRPDHRVPRVSDSTDSLIMSITAIVGSFFLVLAAVFGFAACRDYRAAQHQWMPAGRTRRSVAMIFAIVGLGLVSGNCSTAFEAKVDCRHVSGASKGAVAGFRGALRRGQPMGGLTEHQHASAHARWRRLASRIAA